MRSSKAPSPAGTLSHEPLATAETGSPSRLTRTWLASSTPEGMKNTDGSGPCAPAHEADRLVWVACQDCPSPAKAIGRGRVSVWAASDSAKPGSHTQYVHDHGIFLLDEFDSYGWSWTYWVWEPNSSRRK